MAWLTPPFPTALLPIRRLCARLHSFRHCTASDSSLTRNAGSSPLEHQEQQPTMSVDAATIKKIEEGYAKLQGAKDCHSLLKKYLTKEVVDQLKDKKTKLGATLLDVIQSGKGTDPTDPGIRSGQPRLWSRSVRP
uniref:Phosphagen kinase N-terminal domain-containing protein n=1 Tax=Pristionchus pacificus TaxID=54126 RepID=A0A2A6B565_PRIPA|eukprot:PDM61001.1 hypothetical protein PRIPAC_54807 [Pristionchus pacificus]